MFLFFSGPFFFICLRGSCLVAVFLQSPAPELSENMDLLSGSLAQLRRFSAASHQGVDDLTCTGPSVTARSWKALYSSWVRESSCEFARCCAHPWTLTRAHRTLRNEQCKAVWKGMHIAGGIFGLISCNSEHTSYMFPVFCHTLLSVLFHSSCCWHYGTVYWHFGPLYNCR